MNIISFNVENSVERITELQVRDALNWIIMYGCHGNKVNNSSLIQPVEL